MFHCNNKLEFQETHIMLTLIESSVWTSYLFFYTWYFLSEERNKSQKYNASDYLKRLLPYLPLTFWGNRNIFRLFLSDIFWSCFAYTDLVTEILCFLLLIYTRQCLFLLYRNIFTENSELHLLFSGYGECNCYICKTVCVYFKLIISTSCNGGPYDRNYSRNSGLFDVCWSTSVQTV